MRNMQILFVLILLCSCETLKVISIATPRAERLSYKPDYHFDGYDINHCLILFKTTYYSSKFELATQNDWLYDNSYTNNSLFIYPYTYTRSDIVSNTKDFIYNCTLNLYITIKL